jgi:hypothetical protein
MNLIKTNAFLNPWRWLLGVINHVKKSGFFKSSFVQFELVYSFIQFVNWFVGGKLSM